MVSKRNCVINSHEANKVQFFVETVFNLVAILTFSFTPL